MVLYYVYTHRYTTSDGKEVVFYVGKGKDGRAYDFKSRSEFWKNTAQKYGDVKVSIVAENLEEDVAFELEKQLIQQYGKRKAGGTLVNLADGGEGRAGHPHSDETKAKMSLSHKGFQHSEDTKLRMSAKHTGKKFSDSARTKMSAANTGKKLSDSTKLKMSIANRGKTISAEHRAAMAEGARRMWVRRKAQSQPQ